MKRIMSKTICFYPTNFNPPESNDDFVHIYSEVDNQLNRLKDVVQTSQMCMLHHPNISKYDLIRIVNDDNDIIVIRNNHDRTYDCDRTDKELRYAHNLFKMWEAGTFDRH